MVRFVPAGDLRPLALYGVSTPAEEVDTRQHKEPPSAWLLTDIENQFDKACGLMHAHIGMLRTLNHGRPNPVIITPRRKRTKAYRIVR